MSPDATTQRIRVRFDELQIPATPSELEQLSAYFWLMAKWNTKINLTALPVESVGNAAIDRLLAEPLAAARLIGSTDRRCVDLGSGGGSPAFPLKIGAPQLAMVLVESRERKSAFLREVVRSLSLADIEVVTARFESLPERLDLSAQTDLVSFRAVRADASLWQVVLKLLKPAGRAFWFMDPGGDQQIPSELAPEPFQTALPTPIAAAAASLTVLRKTAT